MGSNKDTKTTEGKDNERIYKGAEAIETAPLRVPKEEGGDE